MHQTMSPAHAGNIQMLVVQVCQCWCICCACSPAAVQLAQLAAAVIHAQNSPAKPHAITLPRHPESIGPIYGIMTENNLTEL
jgi:glutaminase